MVDVAYRGSLKQPQELVHPLRRCKTKQKTDGEYHSPDPLVAYSPLTLLSCHWELPPSINLIKASLGIFTRLFKIITGNPSRLLFWCAATRIHCGSQLSTLDAMAGVIVSRSMLLRSSSVMRSPPILQNSGILTPFMGTYRPQERRGAEHQHKRLPDAGVITAKIVVNQFTGADALLNSVVVGIH